MASTELEVSAETRQILNIVEEGDHFLLSGGAGSGKTYSLVETIREVLLRYPSKTVACITYTNAAVREIVDRIGHNNLQVSTIHDFLWDNIKHYQAELKTALYELIVDDSEVTKAFRLPEEIEPTSGMFDFLGDGIRYKEYVRLKNGIISHDEMLVVAWKMYSDHPRLCGITKDKFPFIFVDEYQDTSKLVVEILLEHFLQSPKKCIVGFFGDAMQSIYPDTVGNLDAYKSEGRVREVKKEQNRRNPRLVIELANKLRNDGLVQHASSDVNAPNMGGGQVRDGCIRFLHSTNEDLNRVREYLGWDSETKELNLTHNLIAEKAGFQDLMEIYDKDKILEYVRRIKKYIKKNSIELVGDNSTFAEIVEHLKEGKSGRQLLDVEPTAGMTEYFAERKSLYETALETPYEQLASLYVDSAQLIDDKKDDSTDESRPGSERDDLIKHLFKIQNNLHLYKSGKFNEFIRRTEFKITSIKDKVRLKEVIESLSNFGGMTIEETVAKAEETGVCKIDDRLIGFQQKKAYVYNRVKTVPFSQFQRLYDYLEGHTPFSTQHKTKGSEYENVLVVLDNGKWNKYNFKYLFDGNGNETVIGRTRKIFYVCCTRAKENLAVFYHDPSPSVVTKAKEWFGEANVVDLDG